MGRIERTLQLASASNAVLKANRTLVLLPTVSLILSLVVLGALGTPVINHGELSGGEQIIIGGLALLVIGVVQAYFHAAITIGAVDHFDGGRPTISSATNEATALLPLILGWALIGWLVSGLAAAARDRIPLVGPLLAGVGEAIWGVVTYLSLPVLVVERRGPIKAIKRSGELLRTTWGENIFGQVAFGLLAFLLLLPVLVIAVLGFAVHPWLGVSLVALGVAGVISYVSALDAVYRVALYRYATAGIVAAAFTDTDFETVFAAKRRRRWLS